MLSSLAAPLSCSWETDGVGASLTFVVAEVSVSDPLQARLAPAKLKISAPTNVAAVLQLPMCSSIAWARIGRQSRSLQSGSHDKDCARPYHLSIQPLPRSPMWASYRQRDLPPLAAFDAVLPVGKWVDSMSEPPALAGAISVTSVQAISNAIPTPSSAAGRPELSCPTGGPSDPERLAFGFDFAVPLSRAGARSRRN